MEEQKRSIFRSETLKRISSPEQLTDYLRVTNPGIWVVLAAVLALLVGFFVWMSVGTIETTVEVGVSTQDHHAEVAVDGAEAGQEPDDDGGEHDDRAGPLDEGPAPLPGAPQDVAPGGQMVGGQLHDEGGRVAREHLGLLQHDA